jgi:hypothetical protein
MAGKITCACGKQYAWKPELAGKRAKCKCGAVVKIPAEDPAMSAASPPPPPPPPVPEIPEGFEDSYSMADDVPPPVPTSRRSSPAGVASSFAPAATASAGASTGGGMKFQFNWRAALTVLGGLAIIAFGVFEFLDITHKEQRGEEVVFRGRRSGWLTILYSIGGRWGVVGLFAVVGLSMIVGAVLVMLGKKAPKVD